MLSSTSNVFLQKSLCLPWSGLHALRSGCPPALPQPVLGQEVWWGEGASVATDGLLAVLYGPVLTQTEVGVESDRC
jgi:hypothetical protein